VESRHVFFSLPQRPDRFKVHGVLKLFTKKPSEHDTPSTWAPSVTPGMPKIYSSSNRAYCSMSTSTDPLVSVLYFKPLMSSTGIWWTPSFTCSHRKKITLIVMSGELTGRGVWTTTTNSSLLQGHSRDPE
jgi:hypothetical protein